MPPPPPPRQDSPDADAYDDNNMSEEEVTTEDKLKAALWYRLGTYVDTVCLSVSSPSASQQQGGTLPTSLNATPHFIGSLTEMVYAQVEGVARDIEAFARHAGRTNVAVVDVMLLTRRNDGLKDLLSATIPK